MIHYLMVASASRGVSTEKKLKKPVGCLLVYRLLYNICIMCIFFVLFRRILTLVLQGKAKEERPISEELSSPES